MDVNVVLSYLKTLSPVTKLAPKGLDLQGHNDVDVVIRSKNPNNPIVEFER